jgi:hypothetical protein
VALGHLCLFSYSAILRGSARSFHCNDFSAEKNMLTLEAERVLAYFRQEYWPNEERSANALQLHRSVVACRDGIQELMAAGMLTESLDKSFFRLTDKGVDALALSDAKL